MKILIKENKNINDYRQWDVWECKPSKFDWQYSEEEHCYIIEGEVTIQTKDDIVLVKSGDYVVFPKGLKCSWDVHKSIRKYYRFK